MLDMLGLTSSESLSKNKITSLKSNLGLTSHGVMDKNYCFTEIFKKDSKHFFTLKWAPRGMHMRQSAILINPSRFNKHSQLKEVVREVFKDKLLINRVDFCSDLNLSIEEIEPRLRVKYKKKKKEFEEGLKLTGMKFGSRNDVVTIYDKAYQLEKTRRVLKKIKGEIIGKRTRFEIRRKGDKVPFPQFDDIQNYLSFNPFSSIMLYEYHLSENIRSSQKLRALYARDQVQRLGFNSFMKSENSSNNFSKTYLKYFKESDLNKELLNNYQQNLSNYLRG